MGKDRSEIVLGERDRIDFMGRLGADGEWNQKGGSGRYKEEGRERVQRKRGLHLGKFEGRCGNLMQWKLLEPVKVSIKKTPSNGVEAVSPGHFS